MKLYTIDKDYFDYIFNNVDNQVLYSHTEENGKGRANVWVKRMEYKGQYQDFAIPEKGDISANENPENSIILKTVKQGGKYSNGFVVNKLMPIESSLLIPFNIETTASFRQIASEITRKEPELIEKTKQHLKLLESGAKELFSTNVDKQLKFLNARAELLNQGVTQEQIYSTSFDCNTIRAESFRNRDKEKPLVQSKAQSEFMEKQNIKEKSKDLDLGI